MDVAGYDFQLLSSGKENADVDKQVVSLAVESDDFTMGGDVGGTAITIGGTHRCIVDETWVRRNMAVAIERGSRV